MVKFFKKSWEMVLGTFKHFMADNAQRMGAALAYYGVLALPAILVTLVFIASIFYNSPDTSSKVATEVNSLMGQKSGQFLKSMMTNPQIHGKGPFATGVAIVVLIISATGVFAELQSDLNSVWGVEARSDIGWFWMILNRVFSFLLLVAIGILLVASLAASTALASLQGSVSDALPGGKQLWHAVEFIISCGIITALFAIIYKFLPDARPHWRDVWVGALVTAFLFTVGKLLLGLYLGSGSVSSPYGVAGSIVLLLVWVYYSAQIFLFGAEFTQIYASRHNRSIQPSKQGMWKAQGQEAIEDREEARTAGKPARTDFTPKPAASSAKTSAPAAAEPAPRAPTAPAPAPTVAHGRETLHELADRVHSWPVLHRGRA